MKNDELYPFYLTFLESKFNSGKLSSHKVSLLKISASSFEDFKYKFNDDELFSKKILKLHKSESRDKKIDDLFDDPN